jgi:hypothetical protein
MTEFEARRVGTAALRLPRLRRLLKEALKPSLGSIVVGSGFGSESMSLGSRDLQAALQLLIDQDEMFLASFNVKIERPDEPIA